MIDVNKIKKLPDEPGVYLFKDKKGAILYVGKATSLRDRVKSYFSHDLFETRGELIVKMIELASRVDFIKTDSVLEALIFEASLIKKHQPYHNTKEKDDKSFNFVIITEEDFPRVLVMRGREVEKLYPESASYRAIFGPFPNGSALREAMKIIRRIFPFRDKCLPAGKNPKPCFNRQIGLCPGVCSGEISKKEYSQIIKHLMMFFDGKKKALLASLEKEMKSLAKEQKFEKAAQVKKTVFALKHIQDVALIRKDKVPESQNGTGQFGNKQNRIDRIEAYDISHFAGTSTVGVMVVVENGEPNKAEYRMFKIRQAAGNDDLKSLTEVLTRRFSHPEWSTPSLVVIDGGQTHLDRAKDVLAQLKIEIPVVSVVKDERHQPKDVLGIEAFEYANQKRAEILLANSEAHRFAIKYHQKVRNRVQLQ